MGKRSNADLPLTESSSYRTILFEIVDTDTEPGDPTVTAEDLLRWMRKRVKVLGSPIPDGYVPPPGIDLEALLKQVPWPPAA